MEERSLGERFYRKLGCWLFVGFISLNASNQSQLKEQPEGLKLVDILRRAREYCRRLEIASLDFVCQEQVSEKIDLSRDIVQEIIEKTPDTTIYSPQAKAFLTSVRSNYLYDYQFVRKDDKISEKRTLLEENGEKKNEPEAKLKTSVFRYQDVLFGPIGLLGEKWQRCYEYEIVNRKLLNGKKTAVIQALPKPWLETKILSGKIWVREDDFSILKIEWHPKSIGHFETVKQRAENYKATPLVTSISEYGFEKNGIRFPSRDFTEEAYLTQKGKKFVRSETTVLYLNYKFFTVETDVKF